MSLLRSFCIAFGMYSKIPMPKFEWNPKDMRYTMCFFPLISIPIALLVLLWFYLCQWLHIHSFLFACVIAAIPVLVTGGIHLDGYCDTVDALSSRQPREKKLEILKDPHIGAFAVLFCCLYFLLYAGFATELAGNLHSVLLLMCSFLLSRCISGFAVVTFRSAKSSGLLHTFTDAAQKRTVACTMIGYFIITATLLFIIDWFVAFFRSGRCTAFIFICTHYVLSPVWRHYRRYCRLFGARSRTDYPHWHHCRLTDRKGGILNEAYYWRQFSRKICICGRVFLPLPHRCRRQYLHTGENSSV